MPLYEGKYSVELLDEYWPTAEYLKDFDTRLFNMSLIEVKKVKNLKRYRELYQKLL